MLLNDDLTRPIIIASGRQAWTPSPVPGVDRRMLFRIGEEKGRATSLVRYRPDTSFPQHTHHGGEEIFVIEGVFQDEHGDYPAGTYIRNPPGTSHVPFSRDGCIIFVKLGQFAPEEDIRVVHRPSTRCVDPQNVSWTDELHHSPDELIWLQQWHSNSSICLANALGLEFVLISGSIILDGEELTAHSWGRLPAGSNLLCKAGPEGVRLLLKSAPLSLND
ncbi:MAG: cupin domain-containing protein [Proteobacteria bacterium]|nr:cupin domain-containing protein [Pseudomonadota bacterium]